MRKAFCNSCYAHRAPIKRHQNGSYCTSGIYAATLVSIAQISYLACYVKVYRWPYRGQVVSGPSVSGSLIGTLPQDDTIVFTQPNLSSTTAQNKLLDAHPHSQAWNFGPSEKFGVVKSQDHVLSHVSLYSPCS